MKKSIAIITSITLSLIALTQFYSCEKYVLPEFSLGKDTLIFNAVSHSQDLEVITNVIWKVDQVGAPMWIRFTPERGEGNDTISITAFENPGPDKRSATVIITSECIKKELLIIQEAPTPVEPATPESGE